MRTLEHPGETLQPRVLAVRAQSAGVLRSLDPGRSIADQLTETVQALGSDSGYAELFTGDYAPVSYCIPAAGDGERAVSFSEARRMERAHLVYGAATIGRREGRPFIHSHCLWLHESGQRSGGHLWPDTLAGSPAPRAVIYALYGARWDSADDPETRMPVFTPSADERNSMPQHPEVARSIDTLVARVSPNEDLLGSVVALCRQEGMRSAVVRGGIGSLVGATFFDRATGQQRRVEGPGTEVISVVGSVENVGGSYETRLACTLVDRHGVVHAGELVPGENAVAVTFELIIQRIS
jgi:predicted DNA-binding protein with PD1-like motif